jgi:hypothetical protein
MSPRSANTCSLSALELEARDLELAAAQVQLVGELRAGGDAGVGARDVAERDQRLGAQLVRREHALLVAQPLRHRQELVRGLQALARLFRSLQRPHPRQQRPVPSFVVVDRARQLERALAARDALGERAVLGAVDRVRGEQARAQHRLALERRSQRLRQQRIQVRVGGASVARGARPARHREHDLGQQCGAAQPARDVGGPEQRRVAVLSGAELRRAQPELEPKAPLLVDRQARGQRVERVAVVRDGLLEREQRHRALGRVLAGVDGALDLARRGRAVVVMGELVEVRLGVDAVERFERAADAIVQARALGLGQRLVQALADQRVRELVAAGWRVGAVIDLGLDAAQDARRDRALEQLEQLRARQLHHLLEHRQAELAPDHGRGRQHASTLGAERLQA